MAKLFNENNIPAVGLTSKKETKKTRISLWEGTRRKIIKDFKEDKYDIIFVRDLFNEGVDSPNADCIVMLRPTQSHTIFTQQIGRGLRKAKGKKDKEQINNKVVVYCVYDVYVSILLAQ